MQIVGHGKNKSKLALILQIRSKVDGTTLSMQRAGEAIALAIMELNEHLPEAFRIDDLENVKIIELDASSSAKAKPDDVTLLKTHKGTLRRRVNLLALTPWLNSLYADSV